MEVYWYWYIVAFVFGAVIGSFLNVLIYRLHTGRSLSGHSHCLSCGHRLSWFELVPVLSYFVLRARCRECSSYIPFRYTIVELLTAGMFVLLWHMYQTDFVLLSLNLLLGAILIAVVVYDIRHTIIPTELTLGILGAAVFYVLLSIIRSDEILSTLGTHILGGVVSTLFFWSLWKVSNGRWIGLGDAKLAFPLGVIVGFQGAISMLVFSFWIGAGISLALIGLQQLLKTGKRHLPILQSPLTIKSEIPFAPFLVLGFLSAHVFHFDIITLTLGI